MRRSISNLWTKACGLIIATVRVGKLESCDPEVEFALGSSSKGVLGDKWEDVDMNVNPIGFEKY